MDIQSCIPTHLIVVVLAEAHVVLEEGQQGKVVLQGLGEGLLPRVAVDVEAAQVEVLPQALDEVVLGQPHPLVRPHTVVTQVLLAVQAVGGGRVLLVTGAAPRLSQVVGVQQASMGVMETRGASTQASSEVVVVAVLVLDLLLGAHHHVQQVAEQEV